MWTLRTSLTSPYGRKARIALEVTGLTGKATVEPIETASDTALPDQNPLGKVPVLLLEDGTAIYDSIVIMEFFDEQAGGGIIVPDDDRRIPALVTHALANGMLDAALLLRMERATRPQEKWHEPFLDKQAAKIARGLVALEANPPAMGSGKPDVGQITVACMLGYLDFRFDGAWRGGHPTLVAWLDDFAAAVPSFAETQPD